MPPLIGMTPTGWVEVKLAEVCDIVPGPSGTRLKIEPRTSMTVPVVMPQDLRNGRITNRADSAVTTERAKELCRYRIRPMDVVAVRVGGLGQQALAGSEQDGWLIGTGCFRLRPRTQLNGHYLAYYMAHPRVREWVIRNGAGSAIPTLTTATLGALPTMIPPMDIQTAIAEALSAFDDKIVVHEEIAETTRALRDKFAPMLFLNAMQSPVSGG